MHLLDAGGILSGHDGGLSGLVGRDDPVQMDDTLANGCFEADRSPVGRVDRACQAVANMVVVRRRIRDFVGDAGDGLQAGSTG